MPRLQDIARALEVYRGRYEFLDAFVDDIEEFRNATLSDVGAVVQPGTHPRLIVTFDADTLVVDLFPEQGIVRCRLGSGEQRTGAIASAVAIGGAVGAALAAAAKAKEGLLGGLVLGMLVGGLVGAAAQPVERVLALQFDPSTADWRLYDGPLLRWAKRTLQPAA